MTSTPKYTRPITIGLLTLPYGLATGWASGLLPMGLMKSGFYLIPAMMAVDLGFSVIAWHVLLSPVVDLGLSLRRWFGIGLALTIIGILPFWGLTPQPGPEGVFKLSAGVSEIGALLTLLTARGYMKRTIPAKHIGRAAGWYQTGILGGQAIAVVGIWALENGANWKGVFSAEALLLLLIIPVAIKLPALRPEKMQLKEVPSRMLLDARSWFGSKKGLFITLMALSPIGVGAAVVAWPNLKEMSDLGQHAWELFSGPLSTVASLVGFLGGGWLADGYGKWKTWLWAATSLAALAILMACTARVPGFFAAEILLYAMLSSACAAAFWAILVAAIGPQLPVTKLTFSSLLLGVALFYTRAFDGYVTDNYSGSFMLVFEAILTFISLGVAVFLFRKWHIEDVKE